MQTRETLLALQMEFEDESTTRDRKVEIMTTIRGEANEAKMGRPCPRCGNYPFACPNDEALIEGHVYSRAGEAEIQITGYCEFCFDLITRDPEEIWT